jgi:DNA-binding transcriptional LysR family regulator
MNRFITGPIRTGHGARRENIMIEQIGGDFLQWLRGFYYVAKRGSVTQAALEMGRNQPTISHQIKCLENEFGVSLFERSSGRMELTPEGDALLEKAISLFESVKKYVALGIGIAILDDYALTGEDRRSLDIFSLDHFFGKRDYGLIMRKKKYLSPAAKAFIGCIKPGIQFK